ncbi:MAG: biotin/lipoyl-binding protein [Magnetococcales bacterium]|nr:biotin/lipoyl-binding protein [Magnetococcales bacterium]
MAPDPKSQREGEAFPRVPPQPLAMLPHLRADLRLLPGGTVSGGAPTWMLWDQLRNQFFRIGWSEFEMMARWSRIRDPRRLIEAVNDETTLELTQDHLFTLLRFLSARGLIQREDGDFHEQKASGTNFLTWLLHHYLFFRIPLIRPDRLLDRVLPWLSVSIRFWGWFATGLAFFLGAYVALRQWDTFTASIRQWNTPEGLAILFSMIFLAKLVHELGHAVMAKRLGCRVPVMGVAFLVLWPFFYTDTNETWRLRRKGDRLRVAAAGIMAESMFAAWGLLAWSMVEDGPWRGALFSLVAVVWTGTLLLNANPFMRFDGYFMLSDVLDLPNLHERAFAMGTWWIRSRLLGADLAPPEQWQWRMRLFLIGFAFATWAYRLVLYLGIALLVYHWFFKLLGMFLMGVELYWFLLRPIGLEIGWWWRNRREMAAGHIRLWLVLFLFGGMAIFLPWQVPVRMPAVLRSSVFAQVFPPEGGVVRAVMVRLGQRVERGDLLARMESPELQAEGVQARLEVVRLRRELMLIGPGFVEERLVKEQKLSAASAWAAGIAARSVRLEIRAPIAGTVTLFQEGLASGLWVGREVPLMEIRHLGSERIVAYVAEKERDVLPSGGGGTFFPDHAGFSPIECHWLMADPFAVSRLEDLSLASVHGGPIEVERVAGDRLRPLQPYFMVHFGVDGLLSMAVPQAMPGMVVFPGRPDSLAGRIGKSVMVLWIRELGG